MVVDLPQGATLEDTERFLMAAADRLKDLPELTSIQAYAGTAAPFNFNGLVRHYYLRSNPEQGDLQVNLSPKGDRARASHAIALDIRQRLAGLPQPPGTVVQGGRGAAGAAGAGDVARRDLRARRGDAPRGRDESAQAPSSVDFIVDVDDTFHTPGQRLRFSINQENLEFYGVEEQAVYDTIAALVGGVKVGYSQRGYGAKPIEIDVKLPKQRDVDGRAHPLDAAARRRHGAPGRECRARRRRDGQSASRASYTDLPPRRAFRRDGAGRSRRPVRGADLRHARGPGRDRADGLGRRRAARRSTITASRSTSRSRRCCGTASGK